MPIALPDNVIRSVGDELRNVSAWNKFFLAMFSNILGGAWIISRFNASSAWLCLSAGVIGPLFSAVISALVVVIFTLVLGWYFVSCFGVGAGWGVGVFVNMYCSGIGVGGWVIWSGWFLFVFWIGLL